MKKITVPQAAEKLGISQTCLREGLVRGKFPFGTGYKTKDHHTKRFFYINPIEFQNYIYGLNNTDRR